MRNDHHLSAIFLIWSWATLAYTGINVAEIVLTTDAYGAGDVGFGVFVAFSAGGILIGSVVAVWFIERLTVYGGLPRLVPHHGGRCGDLRRQPESRDRMCRRRHLRGG